MTALYDLLKLCNAKPGAKTLVIGQNKFNGLLRAILGGSPDYQIILDNDKIKTKRLFGLAVSINDDDPEAMEVK